MDYTHRGMTNQTDRLIAISGIAEAIQRRTKNVYLVGLWKDQLALGLLWNIPFEREFTPTTMFAFNIPPSTRHSRAIGPPSLGYLLRFLLYSQSHQLVPSSFTLYVRLYMCRLKAFLPAKQAPYRPRPCPAGLHQIDISNCNTPSQQHLP